MRLRVLLAGLAVLLCWCDSAWAQRNGGVLRIFHRDNPTSASILEETNASTVVAFMPVFNNLVMFDPGVAQNTPDAILPELAESWSWNDDRTELSFKLRRGVKWHDGSPFSSADIKATYDRIVNPPEGVVSSRKAVHQDIK
jgi:peptide/nickel transport system substrate-binding protein